MDPAALCKLQPLIVAQLLDHRKAGGIGAVDDLADLPDPIRMDKIYRLRINGKISHQERDIQSLRKSKAEAQISAVGIYPAAERLAAFMIEIGRASCRERV